MNDIDLIAAVSRVFARHSRPNVFTDADHCCECAEHDQTLSAHTPATLSLEELGNPGWDPICFATPEAYLYLFPGLARLALTGRGADSYVDQFVFHLSHRIHLLEAEERGVVHRLLWRLFERLHDHDECSDSTLWRLDECLRALELAGQAPE